MNLLDLWTIKFAYNNYQKHKKIIQIKLIIRIQNVLHYQELDLKIKKYNQEHQNKL